MFVASRVKINGFAALDSPPISRYVADITVKPISGLTALLPLLGLVSALKCAKSNSQLLLYEEVYGRRPL